jgi:hypothetical protein
LAIGYVFFLFVAEEDFYKNLASPGDGSGGRHTHVSGDVKKKTLGANGE